MLFEHAYAESPWTLPSHVTLLSGLHPVRHGVRLPEHVPGPAVPLLAEILAEAGWYTFAVTGGGWISEEWGFARGFRSFHDGGGTTAEIVEVALDYLRFRSDKGPWFAFLHTYDVHCPYDPPEPWFSMFRSPGSEPVEVAGRCGNPHFNALGLRPAEQLFLSDRYDGGIRWVDDALAPLFAYLDETEAWQDTVVIVTSDHGEELGEHGRIGHERTLSREALHVPLLLAAPGHGPATAAHEVGLADVVPSVLELLGVAAPALDGRSLVPLLTSGGSAGGVLSDLAWQSELAAWTTRADQLVLDLGDGRIEGEALAGPPPERREPLRRALERARANLARDALEPGRRDEPEPDTLERLRALGY